MCYWLKQIANANVCLISCRSFSAKEPPSIGLFCGKLPKKIRHPMGLRHPVYRSLTSHCYKSRCCRSRCYRSHCYRSHCYRSLSRTGWRRLIGSPKLQIIFHKRATKYRSLLRKMTYKDKGSYESSPPCTRHCYWSHKTCKTTASICKNEKDRINPQLAGATGWQRPIGCLKLQVIFHKRATNNRALFRKMTYKDNNTTACRNCTEVWQVFTMEWLWLVRSLKI